MLLTEVFNVILAMQKNNMSENIDHEAAKEIYQEESKQTDTVKEEIKEVCK